MNKFILPIVALLHFSGSFAQSDTINTESQNLNLNHLPFGGSKYLVYYEDVNGEKTGNTEIWERICTSNKKNNELQFSWKWHVNDSLQAETVHSCNAQTLAPTFRNMKFNGNNVAFAMDNDSIKAVDSIPNNYAIHYPNRANTTNLLSWELDLETLACLPIKKVNQIFEISFFDFNEQETKYHQYIVEKEALITIAGEPLKCWILRIDYNNLEHAQFWISQNNPETLKMIGYSENLRRHKIKLY